MKFFKENSYEIVRLFIIQMGIAIFSLMLYSAIATFDESISDPLKIIVSAFSTVFYLSIIYNVSWEYGSKDKMKSDSGKIQGSKSKGILLGLLANSVNFILGVFCILFSVLYISTGIDGFNSTFFVFNIIVRFIESMYLGMVQGIFSWLPDASLVTFLLESVGFLAFPLLSLLTVYFGYLLGYKDKRLFSTPKKNSYE